ncbi:hypothetical protein [Stenotrophomonas chelatiphaga]|uniref:hypothetical protein n=1 Tax=Stenotrophomonas chelatiphaga TaxID=517011 RepID=UPI0028985B5E|nr:hypothetical protein [Stenotrophomonas chelatiphaga]
MGSRRSKNTRRRRKPSTLKKPQQLHIFEHDPARLATLYRVSAATALTDIEFTQPVRKDRHEHYIRAERLKALAAQCKATYLIDRIKDHEKGSQP